MKVLIYSSLALIAVLAFQVFADEGVHDKIKSSLSETYNDYKDELENFKRSVSNLKEKAEKSFDQTSQDIGDRIQGLVASIREKRSAQTFPESTKNPADEALEKVNTAYNSLKDSVSSFFGNVSNSEVYADVKGHLDNLKNKLQEAGSSIKSTIHNITSESKESEEKH